MQTLLAWLSFAAVQAVLERGRTRRLTVRDALPVSPALRVETTKVGLVVHLARGQPLWRALLYTFRRPLLRGALYRVISELAAMAVPLLIAQCVRQSRAPASPAWLLALALALASGVQFTALNHYIHATFEVALGARSVAGVVVYDKAIRLANPHAQKGRLVALLAKDTDVVENFFVFAHNLWSAPLSAALTCGLLFHLLGSAVIVGVLITAVAIPLETRLGAHLKKLQKAVAAHTDARLHHVANAVSGIRLVKLSLQAHVRAHIGRARALEVAATLRAAMVKALNIFFVTVTPIVVTLGTLSCFVWQGHALRADTVFPALVLFNALGHPFKIFPKVVELRAAFMVACERLELMLASPEVQDLPPSMQFSVSAPRVTVAHAALRFQGSTSPGLEEVNIDINGCGLLCVAGAVGAGKSLLLAGLLGEATVDAGSVTVTGTVAVCPQSGWLCNATVRANVIMNQPFDEARFWDVLAACQLAQEVRALPHGDLTEVGERGHTLSGGQRQRVSLARAFYANRNVYLLDDPLASLDPAVAEAVFVQAILPMAATRPCVMVCNDVQFLARAQHVATVLDGTVRVVRVSERAHAASIPLFLTPEKYPDAGNDITSAVTDNWTAGLLKRLDDDLPSRATAVDAHVYWVYARACSLGLVAAVVTLAVCAKGLDVVKDFELAAASQNPVAAHSAFVAYAGLSAVAMLCVAGRLALLAAMGLRAANTLHDRLLAAVLSAPLSFFQRTPVGRLLVLFSSDVDVVDNKLSGTVGAWAESVLTAAAAVFMLSTVSVWVVVLLGPVLWIYGRVRALYMASSVDLKRLTQMSKEPLLSQLSQSLDGASSIRAYNLRSDMSLANGQLAGINADVYNTHMLTNRWLGFRLDLIGASIVFLAAIGTLTTPAAGTLAGLVLTYAIQITHTLSYGIRSTATLENEFASVERLLLCCATPSERQDGVACEEEWPKLGRVQFDNVIVQYEPNLPPALQQMSFTIEPGQHVGIVGKTGGGKSTTVDALFRLVEVRSGRILIDGADISNLSLASLRSSRMTLVSQEAILFSGKIRESLDPSSRCSDIELWAALEAVGLKTLVASFPGGLDQLLVPANISSGERQLLCLARAIVYDPKIVVLDEASANIDPQSDKVLQLMLATRFKDCTVIKIAHRMEDVVQCDSILVVDGGRIVESGPPALLLSNSASWFSRLAAELGEVRLSALQCMMTPAINSK